MRAQRNERGFQVEPGHADSTPHATLRLLRRRIIEGYFPRDSRLPTRKQLMASLGVSPLTLQRALDRLTKEGFVRSIDRVGSFVAPNPPHLCRYPLVFISSPTSSIGTWNRFWQTLSENVGSVEKQLGMQLPVYTGIDGHADNEDYRSLLRDLDCGRVAGLIFSQNPVVLEESPLLTTPGIPRVAISRYAHTMSAVAHDFEAFFDRAAQYLASHGCRKVAMLILPWQMKVWGESIKSAIARHGLQSRPEWLQVISGAESAQTVVRLLMSGAQSDRPDGLILGDDNYIEHAAAGLIDAQIHVPVDLQIVTHCNFPEPLLTTLPFVRLGWDVRDMLKSALDVLASQRNGNNDPSHRRMIRPCFENELSGDFGFKQAASTPRDDSLSLPLTK